MASTVLDISPIRQSVIVNLLKEGYDLRVVHAFATTGGTASTKACKQTGLEQLRSAIDKLHSYQGENEPRHESFNTVSSMK